MEGPQSMIEYLPHCCLCNSMHFHSRYHCQYLSVFDSPQPRSYVQQQIILLC
jgi:hypothetical protein